MSKVYTVQKTVVLKMECDIVASNAREAKRLAEAGAGAFDDSTCFSTYPTFKVLHEDASLIYRAE